MTVNGHTLTRIQSLARLYKTGYRSDTVDATIEKLIAMERARFEAESEDLAAQLHEFELRYQIPSADFHRRFQAGTLGDDADLFEWSAIYQLWLAAEENLKALQS